MAMGYRIPVTLERQPEGGFTVTSPLVPELLTEGDTVEEAMRNVDDAFRAVLEYYQDRGRSLPPGIELQVDDGPIETERLVAST